MFPKMLITTRTAPAFSELNVKAVEYQKMMGLDIRARLLPHIRRNPEKNFKNVGMKKNGVHAVGLLVKGMDSVQDKKVKR